MNSEYVIHLVKVPLFSALNVLGSCKHISIKKPSVFKLLWLAQRKKY